VRSTYKTIGLWVLLIVLFVAFYNFFSQSHDPVQQPTFTQFLQKVQERKVSLVSVKGNRYSGEFTDTKEKFETVGPVADATMLTRLEQNGVAGIRRSAQLTESG
jgi:cell division protease FtsH